MLVSGCMMGQNNTIDQDKTIRKGKLSNGLTYYIRHNDQTKGVADFYIAQHVGSILEEPNQRGLAHFLEHMAFNGTRNFPGNDRKPGIVKWCEGVGIQFGTNLNAYTSVDQTVYNISSAPVKREGIVDSCLLILHDWSHNLLLTADEIDKERGVVEEEWRTRRMGLTMQRLAEASMPVIYAGTKYADCMPIGDMNIIRTFPYQALRNYYHKWYRPDLQAIIVVGDIDEDQIERKIKALFDTIPMPEHAAERIFYPVADNKKMLLFTATDKEQPTVNFTLYMKRDATPRKERKSLQSFADKYKTSIVRMLINDRLDEYARKTDAPFISASVRDGNFFMASTKEAFEVSGVLKESRMEDGIQTIVGEVERARSMGFTEQELKRGKAEMLSFAESGYNDRLKRKNGDFVEACVENFLEAEPIIDPVVELQLTKRLDSVVTLADINQLAREIISNKNQVVTLYGPEKKGVVLPSKQEIEKLILNAQEKTYEPYQDKQLPSELIQDQPAAGRIVAEKKYKYGYTELELSNGVHVYVRPTSFEDDEVRLKMFSLGGKDMYTDEEMPNLAYLISGATIGGVGRFDDLTLEKMLAGKSVSISPYIDDETEGMNGSSNVKDMETLFQLLYLYFAQPRKDTEAYQNMMAQQEEFLTNAHVNPMIAYNDSLHHIAYNSDRLKSIDVGMLQKVNYERILQIYKERFGNAADFQLILTGNIDMDRLRPILCKYVATLPSNDRFETVGTHGAKLLNGMIRKVFTKEQKTPSATTTLVVKGVIDYNTRNDILLDAAVQLLRIVYTEKVREEKGGTYNVQVSALLQHHPNDEAILRIAFQTDPDKYASLMPIIYEQLEKMATEGPSQTDLDKVKAYELKVYNQVLEMNNYWELVLYNDLYNGNDIDTDFRKIVEGMTVEDVRQILKQLLDQKNRIEVTMTSKSLKT